MRELEGSEGRPATLAETNGPTGADVAETATEHSSSRSARRTGGGGADADLVDQRGGERVDGEPQCLVVALRRQCVHAGDIKRIERAGGNTAGQDNGAIDVQGPTGAQYHAHPVARRAPDGRRLPPEPGEE